MFFSNKLLWIGLGFNIYNIYILLITPVHLVVDTNNESANYMAVLIKVKMTWRTFFTMRIKILKVLYK